MPFKLGSGQVQRPSYESSRRPSLEGLLGSVVHGCRFGQLGSWVVVPYPDPTPALVVVELPAGMLRASCASVGTFDTPSNMVALGCRPRDFPLHRHHAPTSSE